MSSIQVADQTFIAASPYDAAAVIADRRRWRTWWPDLVLQVTEDRGHEGIRWQVSGGASGTMELWLEPVMDGFVLHYFLHAEPSAAQISTSAAETGRALMDTYARINRERRVAGRVMSRQVKARLEAGRAIGAPAMARIQD